MNNNHYVAIMAGGIGSRFWPMSRAHYPKQFLDILGIGRTLIQNTYDRFARFIPAANIYVVTSEEYRLIVKEQLPELKDSNSIVALSVSISARISPSAILSPTFLSHVATVPSVMVSLSRGMVTTVAISIRVCEG